MLVSRARRQLGDPDVIRVENGVYSLRDDLVTDFNQLQRLLDSLAANDPLTTAQRDALSAAFEQFKSTWLSKESVPSIDAAISALRHRVVERLAQDALDRGEIGLAIGFADDLRRRDANDETAYELLIRAYVRSGNNAGALREYRVYSDHLMQELGVEPSFSVAELLEGAH
jgi:DNA-binding SARP family transcriptional activator